MSKRKVSRREFIAGTGAAALSVPFINLGRVMAAQDRPNFVFILTDDQRFDAMSCAGHPFLRTPHTYRLAKEGVRFTNAFVTIALCAPSRACFLSGRYAHSHGVMDNKTEFSDAVPTFPQVLQKAGYDTAYVGKWHMFRQEGPRPGFNRWVSFIGQGDYVNPMINVDGESSRVGGYMTDILTGHAIEWLKRPRTTPFCLYLAHKAVHANFTPAIRHSNLFSDIQIPRPVSMHDDLKGKPKFMQDYIHSRHGQRDDESLDKLVRDYCRTIVGIDDSVGKVLGTLSDIGALDNTVIVFAGDNGFFLGEHGLRDKRLMYEESIRIPLLMRYPRLARPGTLIDQLVLNIDLCPTFLDLAGAQIPQGVQGRSWRPLLEGRASGWRTDFLYEYFDDPPFTAPDIRGVRETRWKYTEFPKINDIPELYDLATDPYELHNLAEEPAHAKRLETMRVRLGELMRETGFPAETRD